jgi:hypothetical protein
MADLEVFLNRLRDCSLLNAYTFQPSETGVPVT